MYIRFFSLVSSRKPPLRFEIATDYDPGMTHKISARAGLGWVTHLHSRSSYPSWLARFRFTPWSRTLSFLPPHILAQPNRRYLVTSLQSPSSFEPTRTLAYRRRTLRLQYLMWPTHEMALTAEKPHTCVVCASRLLFSFSTVSSNPRKGRYYNTGDLEMYAIDLGYDEAAAQARRGCRLMELLVTVELRYTEDRQLRAWLASPTYRRSQLCFSWLDELDDASAEPITADVRMTLCADERLVTYLLLPSLHGLCQFESCFIPEPLTDGDPVYTFSDVASSEVQCRPPNLYPSSPATMARLRTWMQHRVANHKECAESRLPSAFPRRLLEIAASSPVPTLRVVDCSGMSRVPYYAALRYCWGVDQRAKLDKENLTALSKQLPYESLSQTIKDAVKVAVHLGLNHLWIDALCIVQDDPLVQVD